MIGGITTVDGAMISPGRFPRRFKKRILIFAALMLCRVTAEGGER